MRPVKRWNERLESASKPDDDAARWAAKVAPAARALISLGLLSTMWMTPLGFLFWTAGSAAAPNCSGWRNPMIATCAAGLGPSGTRWVLTLLFLPVLTGLFSRLSVVLQWYAVVCFLGTVAIPDGGDHLAMSLCTLLLPLGLAGRAVGWAFEPAQQSPHFYLAARYTRFLVLLQTGFLYAHASLGKLVVPEWLDGSAMWYWSRQGAYGFPTWLRPFSDVVLRTGIGATAITHGTIVAEFFIAVAVLRGRRFKAVALLVGLTLHLMISIAMGLVSFGLSMTALLIAAFGMEFVGEWRERTRFVEMQTDRSDVDLLLVESPAAVRMRWLAAGLAALGVASIIYGILTSGAPIVGVLLLSCLFAIAGAIVVRRLLARQEIVFARLPDSGDRVLRVGVDGRDDRVQLIHGRDAPSRVEVFTASDEDRRIPRLSIRTNDRDRVQSLFEA